MPIHHCPANCPEHAPRAIVHLGGGYFPSDEQMQAALDADPTVADPFPPPMPTGTTPAPHDRLTPAPRPTRRSVYERIAAVRTLHRSDEQPAPFCEECGTSYPCSTIRELDR